MRLHAAAPLCLLLTFHSQGQRFSLASVRAPANGTVVALHTLYVSFPEEAPERRPVKPSVSFRGLSFRPLQQRAAGPREEAYQRYHSLQLIFVRATDFGTVFNTSRPCSRLGDVLLGRADKVGQLLVDRTRGQRYEDVGVYVHTVGSSSAPHQSDVQFDVERPGVYQLIISNCGTLDDLLVTGVVLVNSTHGLLPGDEYHKMPFYRVCLLIYIFLWAVWVMLLLRWRARILSVHSSIGVVLMLGLLECAAWLTFLGGWSSSGVAGTRSFAAAVFLSYAKSTACYVLSLVVAMGWGVTKSHLDLLSTLKILALGAACIILGTVSYVAHAHHRPPASFEFQVMCDFPESILNGSFIPWIYQELAGSLQALTDGTRLADAALLRSFRAFFTAALTVATTTIFIQQLGFAPSSLSIPALWRYQWYLEEGVFHILFLLMLIVTMCLWTAHQDSPNSAYKCVAGHSDAEMLAVEAPCLPEDEDETEPEVSCSLAAMGAEVASLTAAASSAPAAEVVGVPLSNAPRRR